MISVLFIKRTATKYPDRQEMGYAKYPPCPFLLEESRIKMLMTAHPAGAALFP
jgi:hypothetical protein